VLQVYPSTIRRQILRFLYYDTLKSTYLFNGIGRAFLDAVLAEASLEVYLPNVSTRTPHAHELMLAHRHTCFPD
jgi:hypothetical protein